MPLLAGLRREGAVHVRYFADLHIHSKYSRATSRDCDLENLSYWAAKKGIAVVGTGDCTHPAWRAEIRDKLVPSEPGLFRLRPELERTVAERLPKACTGQTRFALSVEISNVYKRDEGTRKVHNLVLLPNFDAVDRLVASLSRIGNLAADGRPILGLDSRDLLEIVLESGSGSFLIPAHIWTPWFSALGAKSGFDSIDACYADLAEHVFAVETGLSSDPPMNWRLSSLDRFRLVSNSDAHSPAKLGREACVFDTELSYFAMREALQSGVGYDGTVEFFPEEGKYHLDGHRKCQVRMEPRDTRDADGKCPVCGKPVTVGVAHRVEELADRPEQPQALPEPSAQEAGDRNRDRFRSFIPLPEILAELLGVGAQSKRVAQSYERVVATVGPELTVLEHAPAEELARPGIPLLAEAVQRMRAGQVLRDAGYDGEYGVIRLFDGQELRQHTAGATLFALPAAAPRRRATPRDTDTAGGTDEQRSPQTPARVDSDAAPPPVPARGASIEHAEDAEDDTDGPPSPPTQSTPPPTLDPAQRAAAEHLHGPLLIVAGPGTGKTRTLTHRVAHLVAEHRVAPESILAITYTRRATEEMRERLAALLPTHGRAVNVMTFHRLGLRVIQENAPALGMSGMPRVAAHQERLDLLAQALHTGEAKARRLLEQIARHRRQGGVPSSRTGDGDADLGAAWTAYRRQLRLEGMVDFDDLLALPVALMQGNEAVRDTYRQRFAHVLVDEYQDVDELQYQLCRLLVPPDGNLCAIGDPDQAIYGFRGADVRFFLRFEQDFPGAKVVRLAHNYRSARSIVQGALQVMQKSRLRRERALTARAAGDHPIHMHTTATDRAEAELVVHTIERLVGGHSFFSMDTGRVDTADEALYGFGDFAVLYRTSAQAKLLVEALGRSGIPFQEHTHQPLLQMPPIAALVATMRAGRAQGTVQQRLERAARALLADGARQARDDPDADGATDDPTPAVEADVICAQAVSDAVARLTPAATASGDDLEHFVSELLLGADVDLWDPRAERVSLLTLHAAKGLEFRVVFVVGCEDGILPLRFGKPSCPEPQRQPPQPSVSTTEELEEERRLFFVGMTRARELLHLMRAEKRLWRGTCQTLAPSPYLGEVDEALRELVAGGPPSKRRKPPRTSQLSLF